MQYIKTFEMIGNRFFILSTIRYNTINNSKLYSVLCYRFYLFLVVFVRKIIPQYQNLNGGDQIEEQELLPKATTNYQ